MDYTKSQLMRYKKEELAEMAELFEIAVATTDGSEPTKADYAEAIERFAPMTDGVPDPGAAAESVAPTADDLPPASVRVQRIRNAQFVMVEAEPIPGLEPDTLAVGEEGDAPVEPEETGPTGNEWHDQVLADHAAELSATEVEADAQADAAREEAPEPVETGDLPASVAEEILEELLGNESEEELEDEEEAVDDAD